MFTIVPEVSLAKYSDTPLALGFYPDDNIVVDKKLPTPKETFYGSFGKLFTKGNSATKVQLFSHTAAALHDTVIESVLNYKVPDILAPYKRKFEAPVEHEKIVIKVSPIKTYRDLLTCFKEALMTHRIYGTSRNGVNGADLVCKPLTCCPMDLRWRGWAFVTVTSMAEGVSCGKLLNIFGRILNKVSMKQLHNDLMIACDKFWRLGFIHNDLHPGNIVYNVRTRTITFIDLETAVEVPNDIIQMYIDAMKNASIQDCHTIFSKTMLQPALHLLRYSEKWLNEFTIKEPGHCRCIYNTDDNLIRMLKP